MIKLVRNTSWFLDEEVRQVIRFVKPRNARHAEVTVRNLMSRTRKLKDGGLLLNLSYFNGFARPEIRPAEVVVRVGPSFFSRASPRKRMGRTCRSRACAIERKRWCT